MYIKIWFDDWISIKNTCDQINRMIMVNFFRVKVNSNSNIGIARKIKDQHQVCLAKKVTLIWFTRCRSTLRLTSLVIKGLFVWILVRTSILLITKFNSKAWSISNNLLLWIFNYHCTQNTRCNFPSRSINVFSGVGVGRVGGRWGAINFYFCGVIITNYY